MKFRHVGQKGIGSNSVQSALLAIALFSKSPQDSKPSVVSAVWLDTCATKTMLAYLSRRLREEDFSKALA
jgi:hypothetical protein